MKKITLMLLAASTFAFNLHAQDDFTKGTDYHLIYLDDVSASKIPLANIAHDYRVDDVKNFLYIWSGTYVSDPVAGPNSNGVADNYLSFSVATGKTWSGWGFASSVGNGKDMSAVTADYTLHFAMKGTNTASHCVIVGDGSGHEGKVTIGATPFIDNGKQIPIAGDFLRDGNWHIIEIPMSTLLTQGLNFTAPITGNIFAMLSGGTAGTNLQIDAIYFYKKVAGPNISILNKTLSGLSSETSSEKSFIISGIQLMSDVVVTPPQDFQISKTTGFGFTSSPISLTQSGGTITSTFYVKLKAGLPNNNYQGNIVITSTGANAMNVICSGTVNNIPSSSPELFNSRVKVYTTPTEIIIDGVSKGQTIGLYTLIGKQLQAVRSQGERIVIPVQPNTVYLVKVESKIYKVIL